MKTRFMLRAKQSVIFGWQEMRSGDFIQTATGRTKFYRTRQAAIRALVEAGLRHFFTIVEINGDGVMV